jgi:hypothetical protein
MESGSARWSASRRTPFPFKERNSAKLKLLEDTIPDLGIPPPTFKMKITVNGCHVARDPGCPAGQLPANCRLLNRRN